MATLIPYNSSAVDFIPRLATSSTGWYPVNQSLSGSEAGCESFSAAAIELPEAAKYESWGVHTLSFDFSGAFDDVCRDVLFLCLSYPYGRSEHIFVWVGR